jgi:hypothetical protein
METKFNWIDGIVNEYDGMEDGHTITLSSALGIEADITQEFIDDDCVGTLDEHRTWYWAISSGYILYEGYAETVDEAKQVIQNMWMTIVQDLYTKFIKE